MSDLNKKYPNNSKVPPKKQVATARVGKKNEPLLVRMFGDNFSNVGSYILWDVLIPAFKTTINDVISNGIEMLLYGDSSRKRIKRDKGRSYVSYSSMYDNTRSREEYRPQRRKKRDRHRFDDVIIENRQEAEQVLEVLLESIATYDVVTVADFYQLVGLDSDWADNKYGWDNLSSASISRVRDGYVMLLPQPFNLD